MSSSIENDPSDEANWSTVETVVRNAIAVEVRRKDNYISGHPPLYSLRVGRARIAADASVWISPHMSIYDLHIACEMIEELGEKYRELRQSQTGRRIVEQKRSTRMSLSKDGVLEAQPSQAQRTTRAGSSRYYDGGSDE